MLTRYDRQTIFTALAFVAVLLKDDGGIQSSEARIQKFANLLGQFCDDKIHSLIKLQEEAFDDKTVATNTDDLIDKHIQELHEYKSTDLPEDYDTLMQMYVRLQFRKIARQNEMLFAEITPQRLKQFVLSQVKAEVEHRNDTRGPL
jgi:hypothetical protein